MSEKAAPKRENVSSHILPTAGTMLGICTTLIGLVKLQESRAGPTSVDQHAGIVAIFFLVSALASYISIRNAARPRLSLALERSADIAFILGLLSLTLVSVLFAYELL